MKKHGSHFLVVIVCSSLVVGGCSELRDAAENNETVGAANTAQILENKMNYRFNIDEWLPRFPLDPNAKTYDGDIITSPCHISNNELLRRGMQDQYVWGPAVPVDIFVMAEGEPLDRHVTKIGGLPYRRADAHWPKSKKGKPLLFLGQFNFADSKDITGSLPGDVLLVFADYVQGGHFQSVTFEWQQFGLKNLVSAKDIPENPDAFKPCYGHIYRTVNYPQAKYVAGIQSDKYPKCHGKDVWSDFHISNYQATQIGPAPFVIQGDPELPGRILCTISSVQPDLHKPFPWIDHADPLLPEGKWSHEDKHMMIGDAGCLYISIDDKGELHWRDQSY